MKTAFMTLGCPEWDLDTICAQGSAMGFDGVDFRGYQDEIDITRLPRFTTHGAATRRQLNDAGLEVCCISSSIRVCDRAQFADNLDEARRTIETAQKLGNTNVRIFGLGDLEQHTKAELAQTGRECIQAILALDGATRLRWLFETHDHWIQSADCEMLLNAIDHPAFGALWDVGHTARVGGETPEQTGDAIGPRIGYLHIKDAVHDPNHPKAMKDGWRYVLPGQGELPLAEAMALLKRRGYTGWVNFEHEKRWHPDLEAPEIAFPAFMDWFKGLGLGADR